MIEIKNRIPTIKDVRIEDVDDCIINCCFKELNKWTGEYLQRDYEYDCGYDNNHKEVILLIFDYPKSSDYLKYLTLIKLAKFVGTKKW